MSVRSAKPTTSLTPLKRTAPGVLRAKDNDPHGQVGGSPAAAATRMSSKRLKNAMGEAVHVVGKPETQPSVSRRALLDPKAPSQPTTTVSAGTGAAHSTTTMASTSRPSVVSRADKEAQKANFAREEEEFVTKFTQAFPTFRFYFDSVEPGILGQRIVELHGKVEKFFSSSCTHVVTTRAPPPIPTDKENAPRNASSRSGSTSKSVVETRAAMLAKGTASPYQASAKPIPSADVLVQAQIYEKKIWHVEKLKSVLGRLTSQPISPHHRARPRHDNLSTLLEDEKLHGTRERDATAPRPDYHYFSRGSFFVLCEDATGEYRTILAKEYEKPKGGAEPEWPVLHSNFLRPSANAIAKTEAAAVAAAAAAAAAKDAADAAKSVSGAGVGVETRTAAAMKRKALFPYAAATTMDPKSRLAAVKDGATGAGDLRRSVSLNNLGKLAATPVPTITTPETHYNGRRGGHDDSHDAYIAASGNSVNLTSTITSAQSGTGHNPGGAGNVGLTDRGRRIVELNKRVVPMTRGTSAATVAAPENVDTATSRAAAAVGDGAACGNGDVRMVDLEDSDRSATKPLTGAQAAAMIADAAEQELKRKTRIMVDHVKRTLGADEPGKGKAGAGAVGKMEPPPVKKRNSLPGGFERREHNTVRLPVREESKKPGYCENCRMKFDDFSQHILVRKHRRFAQDAHNFHELDIVLARLRREPAPRRTKSASIAALRATVAPANPPPPPFKPQARLVESEGSFVDEEEEEEEEEEAYSEEDTIRPPEEKDSDEEEQEQSVPEWVEEEQRLIAEENGNCMAVPDREETMSESCLYLL